MDEAVGKSTNFLNRQKALLHQLIHVCDEHTIATIARLARERRLNNIGNVRCHDSVNTSVVQAQHSNGWGGQLKGRTHLQYIKQLEKNVLFAHDFLSLFVWLTTELKHILRTTTMLLGQHKEYQILQHLHNQQVRICVG